MSESLRNGEFPTWFDTWSMGFPLQSILSWGVFSTPRMLTGFLFNSNIYVLQIEFIFYIILSGWSMYKLLHTHFIADKNLSLLLGCCYMLSGFTVGSSQWLLYITGMTFIPVLIYFLLRLLKTPSFKYSVLVAISIFLLITNVHIYFTVVTFYGILIFLIIYMLRLFFIREKDRLKRKRIIKYLFFAFIFSALICAPPAYYSYEVIMYLERSKPIGTLSFFQSNYLAPDGLSSLILPLSSVRTTHLNTEGTILNTYIGLLPLILAPVSFVINVKEKNNTAWLLFATSIFFILISFGHLLPLRNWLNILPGLSHFRHPGVLRIFFIFSLILYFGASFKNYRISDLLLSDTQLRKVIILTAGFLSICIFVITLFYVGNLDSAWKSSLYKTIRQITKPELLAISAVIQFVFILLLFISIYKKWRFITFLIISELVINTLMCTPFFSISAYSAKEVNNILSSPKGFPIQKISPWDVPASFTDNKNNVWPNTNTYKKEISNHISMTGPLILDNISTFLDKESAGTWLTGKKVAFINGSTSLSDSIYLEQQKPGDIIIQVSLTSPKEIVVQQAYFPGWKAFYNNQRIDVRQSKTPLLSVQAPAGKGTLIFKFEKKGVVISAIILHLLVIIIFLTFLIRKIFSNRLSFHSSADSLIH